MKFASTVGRVSICGNVPGSTVGLGLGDGDGVGLGVTEADGDALPRAWTGFVVGAAVFAALDPQAASAANVAAAALIRQPR